MENEFILYEDSNVRFDYEVSDAEKDLQKNLEIHTESLTRICKTHDMSLCQTQKAILNDPLRNMILRELSKIHSLKMPTIIIEGKN